MSTTRVTKYTVYPDGFDTFVHSDKYLWTLTVEERNPDEGLWSVKDTFGCLNRRGERDYEPSPSNRTNRWLKSHRFPLDEALKIAEKYVEKVVVNGRTARQASEWVAARNAREGRA